MAELEQERLLSPLPPNVIGGALIVPMGLINRNEEIFPAEGDEARKETARIEKLAMASIMDIEKTLGYIPRDVSAEKCGYDVESRIPEEGRLRFIEVKGRVIKAKTVTITKNEILTALNKPDDYILAIVVIDGEQTNPKYVRQPFKREPDFGVTSVNYDLDELLLRAEKPG